MRQTHKPGYGGPQQKKVKAEDTPSQDRIGNQADVIAPRDPGPGVLGIAADPASPLATPGVLRIAETQHFFAIPGVLRIAETQHPLATPGAWDCEGRCVHSPTWRSRACLCKIEGGLGADTTQPFLDIVQGPLPIPSVLRVRGESRQV